MKILIALLFFVMVCFGASTKDTTKAVAKKAKTQTMVQSVKALFGDTVTKNKAKTVTAPQSVSKSAFEETVSALKKQLLDIEKNKEAHVVALEKIEKEASSLGAKSDSVYISAKATLKSIYDKEIEKLTNQEQSLSMVKNQLDQEYQDAIRSVDEAKGLKK